MALFGPLLKIRVIWTYFGDYWFKLTPKVYLIYILPLYRAGLLWDRAGADAAPGKKWTYRLRGCGRGGVSPGRYKWGQTTQNSQTEVARSI